MKLDLYEPLSVHSLGRDRLVGVGDRVAALRGRLELESRPGAGTTVVATLPIPRG